MVREEPNNAVYADHDRVPGAQGMAERGQGRERPEGLNERGGLPCRPVCGKITKGDRVAPEKRIALPPAPKIN